MIRLLSVTLLMSLLVAASPSRGASMSADNIAISPGGSGTLGVFGDIAGESTFGFTVQIELIPRVGTTGTVSFTPAPPADIVQGIDVWPGAGTFSVFDTDSTASTLLNGCIDDNGTFLPGAITFTGRLADFPVVASSGAGGVWDVVLSTSTGVSSWEGLVTTLSAGTITVAPAVGLAVTSLTMPPGGTVNLTVSGNVDNLPTFGLTVQLELIPRVGNTGTVTFTAAPPVDIVQMVDPWPGAGTVTPFDTDTTGSTTMNGYVDDNGTFIAAPITYAGNVAAFPVVASADATGIWDVTLTTTTGTSLWESLATVLTDGTVTISTGACLIDGNCDDANVCTTDTCSAGVCQFVANTLPCDDGLFCTATDVCGGGVCTGSGDPCIDGVVCTVDSCDELNNVCTNTPDNLVCPDDGLFCNGLGVCDLILGCVTGPPPCDDGIVCTDDSCDEVTSTCTNTPNNVNCPDDGLFCNGVESCDALLGCISSGSPCLAGEICDEVNMICTGCITAADCDDANICTNDACNAGVCSNTNNTAPCDDGNPCTNDVCGGGVCVSTNNTAPCNDGLFCTLTDACSGGVCIGSGDSCAGLICDETSASCLAPSASLSAGAVTLTRGGTIALPISGQIAGFNTFGVNILVELIPRSGSTGTVTFTPAPPVDVVQVDDTWPGVGTFSTFDTDTTGSLMLNGSIDDNGTFLAGPVVFSGVLANFPVVASIDAGGVWDVMLSTSIGSSNWEGVPTTLTQGTITVQPTVGLLVNDLAMPPGAVSNVTVSGNVENQSTFGVTVLLELIPRVGAVGTLTFTPAPPGDVFQIDDAWPLAGTATLFDTDTTGSVTLNGFVDDNGSFISGLVTFAGTLAGFPVLASAGAAGVWDVTLTTSSGPSMWENLTTVVIDGAITVVAGACVLDSDCNDGNVCTNDVCNAGVCVSLDNTVVCDDGNICTQGDTCGGGICRGTPTDCSALSDGCNAGTCNPVTGLCEAVIINEGGACDDGNLCTINGVCVVGTCSEQPLDCSGLNGTCGFGTCDPITGTCQLNPINEGGSCDDGNACTQTDTCVSGSCLGTLLAGCSPCSIDLDCDDGNACTADSCHPVGVCVHANVVGACDDGNGCTTSDTCSSGVCSGTPINGCQTCILDTECGDNNTCTTDTCVGNVCQHLANDGVSCDDNNVCTSSDVCLGGACGGTPIVGCDSCVVDTDCNDGNPCTTDTCHVVGICLYNNNTLSCDDGDPCTSTDVCGGGLCAGQPMAEGAACDDGIPCTTSGVCTAGVCVGVPTNDGFACDDGNVCTLSDTCAVGVCAGTIMDCTALNNDCNVGVCDPATATCVVMTTNEGGPCEEGNLCTQNDVCIAGVCLSGTPADCSALTDTCNIGQCDPATGACVAVPTNEAGICNDGSICTSDEVCVAGVCTGTQPDCSAFSDVCNVGTCNPILGLCEATPINEGGSCSDGSACTLNDICVVGTCTGSPIDCSPLADACNSAVCNPSTGSCVRTPINEAGICDDTNPCTASDTCTAGFCGGVPVDCSVLDGNCLVGQCNVGTGLCEAVSGTDGVACDDSDPCTLNDFCTSGICSAGTPVDCSSLDTVCAVGACDGITGLCQPLPTNEGGVCDDGDRCTTGDACASGICVGAATDCSALSGTCTVGTCNPSTGQCNVMATNEGGICDDGFPCTTGDACLAGSCVGTSTNPRQINVVWAPSTQTATIGNPFQIDLVVESNTCIVEEVGSVQVIVQWNSSLFRLDGISNTGPFTWAFSGFPDDSNLDGLNNPFTGNPDSDGLVNYLAFVGFDGRAPVGPGGLVVTTFNFTALSLATGTGTPLTVPSLFGSFTASAVLGRLGPGSDVDMTGTLGSASVTIVECTSALGCDDGNICTDDACVAGLCTHTANTLSCNDGLFCTAMDTCSNGFCIGASGTCPTSPFCNENLNACVECLSSTQCNDGNPCTDNVCSALGVCTFPPNNNPCDDGLFCTINDTCSGGLCLGGGNRCPVLCNELINACVDCLNDVDCNDGNVCTTDVCSFGFCQNQNNTLPCNDGLFCTVTDTCSNGQCAGTGDPCFGTGLVCDDSDDTCQECVVNQNCDDGNSCTDNLCIGRSCFNPNNTAPCEDGLFCTNGDTCSGGTCLSGAANTCVGTPATPICDEAGSRCVECLGDFDCIDGVDCTMDQCQVAAGQCTNVPRDTFCNDGLFCTGVEACDALQGCVASGNPCGSAALCDETNNMCLCQPPTLTGVGSRYLQITPGQAFIPVAFRVDSNSLRLSCLPMYVGFDGRLVSTPFFQDASQWGNAVLISDPFIEPGTQYTVQADCRVQAGDPENLSAPSSAWTFQFGDVNNSKQVDVDDVLRILSDFSATLTREDVVATDLMSCQTDGMVDLADVLSVLEAFASNPYTCPQPCP